jgi:hypothetical protein
LRKSLSLTGLSSTTVVVPFFSSLVSSFVCGLRIPERLIVVFGRLLSLVRFCFFGIVISGSTD